jgi:transposase
MGKRSELSPAQRREAVLAVLRREDTASKIARRYGVSENTLARWRDEFLAGGEAALKGKANGKHDPRDRRIEKLEKEIEQRDQVIGELTIINRVLKKLRGESS